MSTPLKTYEVKWSRFYVESGVEEIEAPDIDGAIDGVFYNIVNLRSKNIHSVPDKNLAECWDTHEGEMFRSYRDNTIPRHKPPKTEKDIRYEV